jgi:hypothetical protein
VKKEFLALLESGGLEERLHKEMLRLYDESAWECAKK